MPTPDTKAEMHITTIHATECINFLQIVYGGKTYSLEEFSKEFKKDEFGLDILLPKCTFIYRGNKISFDEYRTMKMAISNELSFFERCHTEIMPMEPSLQINNYEYYRAAKFLEKAEDCLQTARYYLMNAADILEYDCVLNWATGYGPIYEIRTMNFKTAIVWYNNCFDYILQIVFLAFELYKGMNRYNAQMSFEEILKLCSYMSIQKVHDANSGNVNLDILWNILENCRNSITDINEWANYSKHKGGIGFKGLKADAPFQIITTDRDGNMRTSSEFESIKIELDDGVTIAKNAHKVLYDCLNQVVDFIDFGKATHTIDDQGRMVIPDKTTYVKVIL